jgi:hypothetical protein
MSKKIQISKDTLNWFKKLPLTKKLLCIEEQIKVIKYFGELKPGGKNIYKRNYRKI